MTFENTQPASGSGRSSSQSSHAPNSHHLPPLQEYNERQLRLFNEPVPTPWTAAATRRMIYEPSHIPGSPLTRPYANGAHFPAQAQPPRDRGTVIPQPPELLGSLYREPIMRPTPAQLAGIRQTQQPRGREAYNHSDAARVQQQAGARQDYNHYPVLTQKQRREVYGNGNGQRRPRLQREGSDDVFVSTKTQEDARLAPTVPSSNSPPRNGSNSMSMPRIDQGVQGRERERRPRGQSPPLGSPEPRYRRDPLPTSLEQTNQAVENSTSCQYGTLHPYWSPTPQDPLNNSPPLSDTDSTSTKALRDPYSLDDQSSGNSGSPESDSWPQREQMDSRKGSPLSNLRNLDISPMYHIAPSTQPSPVNKAGTTSGGPLFGSQGTHEGAPPVSASRHDERVQTPRPPPGLTPSQPYPNVNLPSPRQPLPPLQQHIAGGHLAPPPGLAPPSATQILPSNRQQGNGLIFGQISPPREPSSTSRIPHYGGQGNGTVFGDQRAPPREPPYASRTPCYTGPGNGTVFVQRAPPGEPSVRFGMLPSRRQGNGEVFGRRARPGEEWSNGPLSGLNFQFFLLLSLHIHGHSHNHDHEHLHHIMRSNIQLLEMGWHQLQHHRHRRD